MAGAVTAGIGFAVKNAGHLHDAWDVINRDGRASAGAKKLADQVKAFVGERDPSVRLRKQIAAIEASLTGEAEASTAQVADSSARLSNVRRRIDLADAEPSGRRRKHLRQLDQAVAAVLNEIVATTVTRELGDQPPRRRLGRSTKPS